MVIYHSVSRLFSGEEVFFLIKNKINNIVIYGICGPPEGQISNNERTFVLFKLSNDPFVWFHSSSSFTKFCINVGFKFLLSMVFANSQYKAFFSNWLMSFSDFKWQDWEVFFMKIRTFLQIVRLGKITASRKANLSINKTNFYPQIQTRTHDADLEFKQNPSDSLFSKLMILNLLCASPCGNVYLWGFDRELVCKNIVGHKNVSQTMDRISGNEHNFYICIFWWKWTIFVWKRQI